MSTQPDKCRQCGSKEFDDIKKECEHCGADLFNRHPVYGVDIPVKYNTSATRFNKTTGVYNRVL